MSVDAERLVVRHRLYQLQDKISQDALTVIDRCDSHDELDFLFPEITRIHNHDLAVLDLWQIHVDWMRSLPPSELKLLNSADFNSSELTASPDTNQATTGLVAPPEQLLYDNLTEKSHFYSLRDQLLFMFEPKLRREYEFYINQQAKIAGYKSLVPSNLQQSSDLAVANLYYYFKIRDESENQVELAIEQNSQ